MPSSRSRLFGCRPFLLPWLQRSRWPRLPSHHGPRPRRAHPHLGARLAVRGRPGAAPAAARGRRPDAAPRGVGPGLARDAYADGARDAVPCQPRPSTGDVLGRAWGPGAEWALDRMPALLGADDDPTGFEPHHHPEVAAGWRTHQHWRIGATGLVMESLVPSILEQKVTGKQAFGSFRELVRRHGEPAPGPVAPLRLMLQPTPGHDRRDPVLGVAAPRCATRPVAHPRHRLPARAVAGADHRGVDRRGRPAAPFGPRHRRLDQRRGAPARSRRPRRRQLRRLPRRQLGRAGRSSATTSPTTRWRSCSSPTGRSGAGPSRWRWPAGRPARAAGRG